MKKKFHKNEISEVSQKLLEKILGDKSDKAKVIALSGDLGAGKTTLTKELGKLLGIREDIISPTFVIMKIYEIGKDSKHSKKFKKLFHIDAYRFEHGDELSKIGWNEIIKDKENLVIIEWPEKVKEHILPSYLKVDLKHLDEENRLIEF